jgi:hypothetical protein
MNNLVINNPLRQRCEQNLQYWITALLAQFPIMAAT